jgi:hypothetical protein
MKRLIVHIPLLITLLAIAVVLLYGPIEQVAGYHDFADTRSLFGVPNAADILSNIGFALIGAWGLIRLWPHRYDTRLSAGWPGYCLFLIALVLTAAGSGYYHLAPDNARLFWDRLPIALACAGLLAGVRAEPWRGAHALRWTCLLAIAAMLSVWWWRVTDQAGQGDLRFCLLFQLLTLILIPLWQAIYDAPRATRIAFGAAIAAYVIAKAAELNDHALFVSLEWVSGHTVKHLMSVLAAGLVTGHLVNRVDARSFAANLRSSIG